MTLIREFEVQAIEPDIASTSGDMIAIMLAVAEAALLGGAVGVRT
jgi:hypothetical protein